MICAVNIKEGGTIPPCFISEFTTLNLPMRFTQHLIFSPWWGVDLGPAGDFGHKDRLRFLLTRETLKEHIQCVFFFICGKAFKRPEDVWEHSIKNIHIVKTRNWLCQQFFLCWNWHNMSEQASWQCGECSSLFIGIQITDYSGSSSTLCGWFTIPWHYTVNGNRDGLQLPVFLKMRVCLQTTLLGGDVVIGVKFNTA